MSDIQTLLDDHIPEAAISQKQGLDYVSHRYVKDQLNAIFGWDGWHYKVLRADLDRENMGAFVHVRLTIVGPDGRLVERDGLAFGFAAGQQSNQSYDFAIAEAVTDALKRAAVSLGNRMGLELYPMKKGDKRQSNSRLSSKRQGSGERGRRARHGEAVRFFDWRRHQPGGAEDRGQVHRRRAPVARRRPRTSSRSTRRRCTSSRWK